MSNNTEQHGFNELILYINNKSNIVDSIRNFLKEEENIIKVKESFSNIIPLEDGITFFYYILQHIYEEERNNNNSLTSTELEERVYHKANDIVQIFIDAEIPFGDIYNHLHVKNTELNSRNQNALHWLPEKDGFFKKNKKKKLPIGILHRFQVYSNGIEIQSTSNESPPFRKKNKTISLALEKTLTELTVEQVKDLLSKNITIEDREVTFLYYLFYTSIHQSPTNYSDTESLSKSTVSINSQTNDFDTKSLKNKFFTIKKLPSIKDNAKKLVKNTKNSKENNISVKEVKKLINIILSKDIKLFDDITTHIFRNNPSNTEENALSLLDLNTNILIKIFNKYYLNLIKENKNLTAQNQTLIKENKDLTAQNQTLIKENKDLTAQNQTLTEKNKSLTTENENLTASILQSQTKHQNNINAIKLKALEISNEVKNISTIIDEINSLQKNTNNAINTSNKDNKINGLKSKLQYTNFEKTLPYFYSLLLCTASICWAVNIALQFKIINFAVVINITYIKIAGFLSLILGIVFVAAHTYLACKRHQTLLNELNELQINDQDANIPPTTHPESDVLENIKVQLDGIRQNIIDKQSDISKNLNELEENINKKIKLKKQEISSRRASVINPTTPNVSTNQPSQNIPQSYIQQIDPFNPEIYPRNFSQPI